MIDRYLDYLTRCLIEEEKDYKIYRYAFNRLKIILVWCLLLIVVGIVSGSIKTTFVLLLAITPIRKFGGGYHLKSEFGCFVVSSAMLFAATRIVLSECVSLRQIWIISIVASFFILIIGTIESDNNPLSKSERRIFGMITRFFLVLEMLIAVILYFSGITIFAGSILLSIIICAVLQLIGFVSRIFAN